LTVCFKTVEVIGGMYLKIAILEGKYRGSKALLELHINTYPMHTRSNLTCMADELKKFANFLAL
jgi:hypothetical protein